MNPFPAKPHRMQKIATILFCNVSQLIIQNADDYIKHPHLRDSNDY